MCLIFSSCINSKDIAENQLAKFDLKASPQTVNVRLSELGFRDIEYIPLETTDQSVIQGIYKIIPAGEFYLLYVYDRILSFCSDGSFNVQIGKSGRGPDEFLVIHDLDFDDRKQQIYIVDGWNEKFYVYSERGDLIRMFPSPIHGPLEFKISGSRILCYVRNDSGNTLNSYYLIDTIGGLVKKFPNRFTFDGNIGTFAYLNENLFYRFKRQLFKKEIYSDTVYSFDGLNFRPHLIFDVGQRLLTPAAHSEFNGEYLSENYITPRNLFEFGDYVYYEYLYENKYEPTDLVYGFIGSKEKDFHAFINSGQGIYNDLDGGPDIWPKTTRDDNTILTWIDAIDLKKHVASEAFRKSKPLYPEKKKELEKLANSLKETDNPVLVLVRLKD